MGVRVETRAIDTDIFAEFNSKHAHFSSFLSFFHAVLLGLDLDDYESIHPIRRVHALLI